MSLTQIAPLKRETSLEIDGLNRVNLVLIKPSCYDDEGYVVSHFRGVLPSNTLACLASLTERACRSLSLKGLHFKTTLIDEAVMRINFRRIIRSHRSGSKTIVCLVGVQTHQFPRASDIAARFREAGLTVIIGGFHVSGHLAMLPGIPSDIQSLMDQGVTIVKGEVEEAWQSVLEDAVRGKLLPLYDFSEEKPDLSSAPVPVLERSILKKFVSSNYGTIDCGRGCPFNCSFCTIINVQGRKMRVRSPEAIANAIRKNYRENGVSFYFFTDDNWARNKNWDSILDALIALREEENIPVEFMMQVDVLSHKINGFIKKARRAGCSNVFIGMESINDSNLKAAGKKQNKVEDYRTLIDAYRNAEIATHVGFIVGFPFDTPESLRKDLDRLANEVGVDMASFFVLTPLPGSRDHLEMNNSGAYMDSDYNRYDSQHVTMDFPNFPDDESFMNQYWQAWEDFYSFESMRRILRRAPHRNYWNLFRNFLWYKYAAVIERRHPMMTGLLRLKGRTALRPGIAPLPRKQYVVKRFRELKSQLFATISLLLEMQLLWLETRKKSQAEQHVLDELQQLRSNPSLRVRLDEIQTAYIRARKALPDLDVPSRFRLFVRKWSPFSSFSGFYSAEDILAFWNRSLQELQRGRIFKLSFPTLFPRIWHDFWLSVHFAAAWMRKSGAT
jgi:radical SAM superfamily enzyme YgiQ (UPF0313 family)